MPRRRQYGRCFRKRKSARDIENAPREVYYPGWYVRLRQNGQEVTRYGGATRATAVEFLRKLQGDAERLHLLGEFPENETTFGAFAEEYLAWCKRSQTKDTYDRKRSAIRSTLITFFDDRRLQDIDSPDIERFLLRNKAWSAGTRNRYLSMLSAIYKRAIELGYVRGNPAIGVHRSRETRKPLPLVSIEQQQALLDAMPEHLHLLVLMALDTGARLGELLRIEWRDVDLKQGAILIRRTKNHRPRLLRTSARLRRVLAGQREEQIAKDQRIFPALIGGDERLKAYAHRTYRRTCADVGLPDLRFHDLRHLTAINLVRAGLDLPSVQATLGHKSLESTLRYAEYADETAAGRAASVLDRLHGDTTLNS